MMDRPSSRSYGAVNAREYDIVAVKIYYLEMAGEGQP